MVWKIILGIIIVLLIILGLLYFFGRKAMKKADAQKEAIDAAAQTVNMLIIDKKKMKMSEANLPKVVLEQTPKYLKRTKLPIVKAKIGPQIMTLIADEKVFEILPVKTEVKGTISGIYLTNFKLLRGTLPPAPKKKKFTDRFKKSANENTTESSKKKSTKDDVVLDTPKKKSKKK